MILNHQFFTLFLLRKPFCSNRPTSSAPWAGMGSVSPTSVPGINERLAGCIGPTKYITLTRLVVELRCFYSRPPDDDDPTTTRPDGPLRRPDGPLRQDNRLRWTRLDYTGLEARLVWIRPELLTRLDWITFCSRFASGRRT